MSKILIVDDEADFEFLTQQKFRKRVTSGDYTLFFARNGVQALEVMAQEGPMDVLVTDLNMPEMDGITLLDHVRQKYPATRSIVVSAYSDTESLRGAMNKGAFDFVTKPVNFQDLESTIDKAIGDLAASTETTAQLDIHSGSLTLDDNPSPFDLRLLCRDNEQRLRPNEPTTITAGDRLEISLRNHKLTLSFR